MLISADRSCLLIVDVQSRLAPAIENREAAEANCAILLKAAARLSVPVLASEQYPKGLGVTVEALQPLIPEDDRIEKTAFSCLREVGFADRFKALGRPQAVVAGMETHVCVLQTALDLQQSGTETFVVADASGSRRGESKEMALQRLTQAGVTVVTTEMVVFEWLRRAGSDDFKALSKLIK